MYTDKSMYDGTVEVKVTAGGTTQTMASYSLCVVGFECAIAAGTNFELVLAEVPLEYIEVTIIFLFAYIYKNKPQEHVYYNLQVFQHKCIKIKEKYYIIISG